MHRTSSRTLHIGREPGKGPRSGLPRVRDITAPRPCCTSAAGPVYRRCVYYVNTLPIGECYATRSSGVRIPLRGSLPRAAEALSAELPKTSWVLSFFQERVQSRSMPAMRAVFLGSLVLILVVISATSAQYVSVGLFKVRAGFLCRRGP
jgi:hypothetical protein